jgi:hypothetical protein
MLIWMRGTTPSNSPIHRRMPLTLTRLKSLLDSHYLRKHSKFIQRGLPASKAFKIETNHLYLRSVCRAVNSFILQDAQREVILHEPGRQILCYGSLV